MGKHGGYEPFASCEGGKIFSDSSGNCYYYRNADQCYAPLQYDEGSGKINITTSNFATAKSFNINGYTISPEQCTLSNPAINISSSGAEHGGSAGKNYTLFATYNGRYDEKDKFNIYYDSDGKLYYKNNSGIYVQMKYGEGSKMKDITMGNYFKKDYFVVNNKLVHRDEYTQSNFATNSSSSGSESGGSVSKYLSSSIGDIGGYATNAYNSVLEIKPMESTIEYYFSSQKNGQSSSIDIFDFTIDSEIQDDLSSKLKVAADAFEQKVTLMYREIGNMANYWVGEDYDAYCQATDGYKNALGDLSDSIRMYGKHFKEMSDSTEDLTNQLIEIVETCTSRHVK